MKTNLLLCACIIAFTFCNPIYGQGYDTLVRTIEVAPNYYFIETFTSDTCLMSSYFYAGDSLIISPVTNSSFEINEPFGDDELNTNIWLPDDDRGCLPYDVCFNPTDDKYYLYGGRKILIIDAGTNTVIQDHVISESGDNMQLFYISVIGDEKRVVYVESSDKIFCATDDGKLVLIDGGSDERIPDAGSAVQYLTMVYTSLHYNSTKDRIF